MGYYTARIGSYRRFGTSCLFQFPWRRDL